MAQSTIQIPKLRSSCDNCGVSKTKCDRKRPTCGRCTGMGRICVYGVSRQTGKPPRKRPGSHLEDETRKRSMTIEPRATPARNEYESTIDPISTWSSNLFGAQSLESPFSLTFQDWNPIGMETGLIPIQSSASITPKHHQESHSCARESYEIFRDLICPAPDLHAPESTQQTISASLDQVLHCNRNAIERLGRLLTCSCSRSGHRVMVHASILSRMLIWYQQAALPKDLPPNDSSLTSELPEASTGSSPQITGFIVEHVPVSVGTFNVEDQNMQAAFRYRMILKEVKKTKRLIQLLGSLDSELTAVGVALGAWLQSEYSHTVAIIASRLHSLEQSSTSALVSSDG
jgi:hypothetical protein